MNNTWFISDLYFWHANILKYNPNRPYSNVQDMNEGLIYNWNSVVKSEDKVYCLGDVSFNFRSIELYSHRLNGKKFLCPGNHDFVHSYNKKSRNEEKRLEWIKKYEEYGWTILEERTTLDIEGVGVVNICHMPYASAKDHLTVEGQDKYANWRPKDDGKFLLHGHIHSTEQRNLGKRMIDCGVDANNCFPISEKQIVQLILDNPNELNNIKKGI